MHARSAEFIDGFTGTMTTTGAVISEVMYFVSESTNGAISFAQLLLDSEIRVEDCAQPEAVLEAAKLMTKYAGTPMDFADATLVLLADQIEVTEILTLDRKGFSTYRTPKGKAFRLALRN
jgi:hypothetical protein